MKLELSEGSAGAWSFRIKNDAGRVLAEGVHTYENKAGAIKGVQSLRDAFGDNLKDVTIIPLNGEAESIL